MGFRRASRQGFAADVSAGELGRILLLDDVYTTGARINSASYAISHAGGVVAGALVLARRINTDYDARALALWERQQAQGFDWRASPIVGG
jgi:orotate phosphoribosyltransferase